MPTNLNPPTIFGESKVGSTLTGDPSQWDFAAYFYYSWLRDGVPIDGAESDTYTLVKADKDHLVSFGVLASDFVDYTYAESAAVGPITTAGRSLLGSATWAGAGTATFRARGVLRAKAGLTSGASTNLRAVLVRHDGAHLSGTSMWSGSARRVAFGGAALAGGVSLAISPLPALHRGAATLNGRAVLGTTPRLRATSALGLAGGSTLSGVARRIARARSDLVIEAALSGSARQVGRLHAAPLTGSAKITARLKSTIPSIEHPPLQLFTAPVGAGADVVSLVQQLNARLTTLAEPSSPARAYSVGPVDDLPPAADFARCVVFVNSKKVLVVSDGAHWVRQDNLQPI